MQARLVTARRLLFVTTLSLLIPNVAVAWGNRSAHPAINTQSLALFREQLAASVSTARLELDVDSRFVGEAVSAAGYLLAPSGKRSLPMPMWLLHGGFSADEPEAYAALRHFYDPLSINGHTFLTDGVPDGASINPQIDAREWALSHRENPYSFERALGAYANGWRGGVNRETEFAKAFRALGETMHLVADMVQPAHVRNDAHAFSEPIEDTVDGAMVNASAGGPVDARAIVSGLNVESAFEHLARFVNANLYSRDTIFNPSDPAIDPANGQTPNPDPIFSSLTWDATQNRYVTDIAGQTVTVAQETLSSYVARKANPSESPAFIVSASHAAEQAAVLIPIAVEANADLLRRFFPELSVSYRLDVEQESWDGDCIANIGATLEHHVSNDSEWYDRDPITYSGPAELMKGEPGSEAATYAGTMQFDHGTVLYPLRKVVPFESELDGPYFIEIRVGGLILRSDPFYLDCSAGCVAAGTPVALANGERLAIEQVAPGQEIAAYDFVGQRAAVAKVEEVFSHREAIRELDLLVVGSGQSLSVTGNHPIYVVGLGFIPAAELVPGDTLVVLEESTGAPVEEELTSIVRAESEASVVYNLRTSRGHYFAADFLVHNKCVARDSLIDTPSGARLVQSIVPGDLVWGERDGERVPARVINVFAKRTVLESLPGRRISRDLEITANHVLHSDNRCLPASSTTFAEVRIAGEVYDLATDTGNYFSAGELLEAARGD